MNHPEMLHPASKSRLKLYLSAIGSVYKMTDFDLELCYTEKFIFASVVHTFWRTASCSASQLTKNVKGEVGGGRGIPG